MGDRRTAWHSRLAILVFLMQILSTGHAKQGISARYDLFGPYTVPQHGDERKTWDELAAFVWVHWRDRRPGYAVVTTTSRDAVVCTNTYIVEPEEGGQWHVVNEWKCKNGHRPRKGRRTASSVERLATDSRGHWGDETLPDSAMAAPGSFVLRLRDKSGRIQWVL